MARPPLYGLDIVTDTPPGPGRSTPIDPVEDRVLAVGLSLAGRDLYLDHHDEADLLAGVDDVLADLPPGVLVTWQGGLVDLPVLAARARHLEVEVGLRLRRDARDRRGSPVLGATGGYCGRWHDHRHLDLARVYDAGPRLPLVRRGRSEEDLIPPVAQGAWHDPCPDARLARCLADRRWPRARRFVDRVAPPPGHRTAPPASDQRGERSA